MEDCLTEGCRFEVYLISGKFQNVAKVTTFQNCLSKLISWDYAA